MCQTSKLWNQISQSSIGIQSLNIRAGSSIGAVPERRKDMAGQKSDKPYNDVGINTMGRITPNKSLKKIGNNEVSDHIAMSMSR